MVQSALYVHLARTIRDYDFKCGNLVLIRNTQYEKSLNCKMHAWYLGPLIIISCNFGGAYILCELNSTVLHCPIAAFRVIFYFAWRTLMLPADFMDTNTTQLRELESTTDIDGEDEYSEVIKEELDD